MTAAYIIVYAFGTGGRTVAILDQCRMFLRLGISPTIVTFNFDANFSQRIQSRRDNGDIPDGTRVINIYEELRSEAAPADEPTSLTEPAETCMTASHLDGSTTVTSHFDRAGRLLESRHLRQDGTALRTIGYADEIPVRRLEFDATGSPLRELTLTAAGAVASERYLAADGFCYVTRKLNPDTGKQEGIFVHDRNGAPSTRYAHNTPWHTSWLDTILSREPRTLMAIAESPSAMTKLLDTSANSATKMYFVHDNHFKSPYTLGSPLRDDYSGPFRRSQDMDTIICPTAAQADDLRATLPDAPRISSVPNVIRDKRSPKPASSVPGRIGVFCRLAAEQKRVDLLLRIFSTVLERRPDARLEIFGDGPDRGRLEKIAKDLSLTGSVTFHGRIDGVGDAMASCAVTATTASSEAFGLSIGESLAAGTPVISFAINYGPRDLIRDGVDGRLIDEADESAYAEALIALLDVQEQTAAMGERGAQRMAEEFSLEAVTEEWGALIQDVTGWDLNRADGRPDVTTGGTASTTGRLRRWLRGGTTTD
ncbi:glycosyltransferase [Brachybacterium squillarum]|uniref:glycosyltransferase n=1 Tax=Brachybacterium squillarum TaxID=661979 RepID=UPI000262957F|nr:glycosyltransferase [Brachybacterium squillarum]